ncbi:cyanophycinase [Oceanicoccus sp. KOV_DT_Chl]|uniref:cyanophycinase n=1 Tax=Oceanicoccus sp. KOV_DT_Chl TaxID=1904639 RepID=UPI000C7B4E63|nr:cyanophycinase [Oceanicoccus sp. KOV_DT_Chl]
MRILLLLLSMLSLTANAAGKLVIVGGALSSENEAVYRAFIDALPSANSKIAIFPVASSSPVSSAQKFRKDLVHYGVDASRVEIIPLATKDDLSTEFDESSWRNNASSAQLATELTRYEGFWFVGGDQMRIIETLLPRAQKPSRLLLALRKQLEEGAVIGGTSAGAAMMSNPMIAGGDSFSALTTTPSDNYYGTESQEYGRLYLHHGLGFFPYGLVDQHFDRKSRLGRLARALLETEQNLGVAVDEDTAMVVDLASHELTAVGSGAVTLLNRQSAKFQAKPFKANNLQISLLASGDRYNLVSHSSKIAGDPKSTVGREYASGEPHQGAGLLLPNQTLSQMLGYDLLDNADSRELRRYSFVESGDGFLFRFRQTPDSAGYWRYRSGSRDQYSIINVMLDVEPVTISVSAER